MNTNVKTARSTKTNRNTVKTAKKLKDERATTAIRLIHGGATWEQVAEAVGLSVHYLKYKIVRPSYERLAYFDKLCERELENEQALAEADALLNDEENVESESDEIVVVETGYLMCRGAEAVQPCMCIPDFCLRELENLRQQSSECEKIIRALKSPEVIKVKKRKENEKLLVNPSIPAKHRSVGVVSLCCDLYTYGFRVRLLTNSREVAELAELQGIGIIVEKID